MPTLSLAPVPLEHAIPMEMEYLDLADRVGVMRAQEETTYRVRDYMAESVLIRKAASKPVDEDCRVKMCEWYVSLFSIPATKDFLLTKPPFVAVQQHYRCYQVVDFCKFRRETVGIGMSYLDRFLCTKKGEEALCNRKLYQLAAMTALYIAIKLHEPLEMETSLLADLSRGCYTEMEFVGMEQTILSALEFRVNGPTPLGFVQHFVAMMPKTVHPAVTDLLLDYARYQTELAVSEQSFASIKPSEIGLAAVLNAMEGMDQTLMPPNEQGRFIRLIEKNTELFVEEAERAQSKLSLLMVSMISKDYERIMNSMDNESGEAEYEKGGKQSLSRRNSPKSVIRR